jgi:hypothetical protein
MGTEVVDDIVMMNPSEVIEFMKKVPFGQFTTVIENCKAIGGKYHVKGCCSLTTGFLS